MSHVPTVHFYPASPDGSAKEPIEYDTALKGFGAPEYAHFISQQLGTRVKTRAPIITKSRLTYATVGLFVTLIIIVSAPHMNLQQGMRSIALVVCLGFIFTFTSGYMFTRIRHTAPMGRLSNGNVELIAGGFGNMHTIESSILIALYTGIVLAVGLLTSVAPKAHSIMFQRLVVVVGVLTLVGLYGFLISLFHVK